MLCMNCNKEVKLGKLYWIHVDTNDTWCDPKQDQFAWKYNTALPESEGE